MSCVCFPIAEMLFETRKTPFVGQPGESESFQEAFDSVMRRELSLRERCADLNPPIFVASRPHPDANEVA